MTKTTNQFAMQHFNKNARMLPNNQPKKHIVTPLIETTPTESNLLNPFDAVHKYTTKQCCKTKLSFISFTWHKKQWQKMHTMLLETESTDFIPQSLYFIYTIQFYVLNPFDIKWIIVVSTYSCQPNQCCTHETNLFAPIQIQVSIPLDSTPRRCNWQKQPAPFYPNWQYWSKRPTHTHPFCSDTATCMLHMDHLQNYN